MNYVLIDGNNMACRSCFANKDLVNSEGVSTGAHYGFFNSIFSLKRQFPNAQFLVAWDSKSKRRVQESKEAVLKGIIPEHYKENRKKKPLLKPLEDFYASHDLLKKALGKIGIPQIHMSGYEADDILVAYARVLTASGDNEATIVTSDRDYYQALSDRIHIWDGMKSVTKTLETLKAELGVTPSQYIDCGALMGDDGDNIFGVPGWGEKTTLKEIIANGSWEKVMENAKKVVEPLREKYPDLNTYNNIVECDFFSIKEYLDTSDSKEELEQEISNLRKYVTVIKDSPEGIKYEQTEGQKMFEELATAKTEKLNAKWPDIYFNQPYTGVAYAIEKGLVKLPKTTINLVMFEDRVRLAYSLKKIDEDIDSLPEIVNGDVDIDKLFEYFDYYEMESLKSQALELFGQKVF